MFLTSPVKLVIRIFRLEPSCLVANSIRCQGPALIRAQGRELKTWIAKKQSLGHPRNMIKLKEKGQFLNPDIVLFLNKIKVPLSFVEWKLFIFCCTYTAAPTLPQLAHSFPNYSHVQLSTFIDLHVHHPSFNWMNAGGEEKAHSVLERMGGLLSVKRAIPINQLFKSRLQALGAYRRQIRAVLKIGSIRSRH